MNNSKICIGVENTVYKNREWAFADQSILLEWIEESLAEARAYNS